MQPHIEKTSHCNRTRPNSVYISCRTERRETMPNQTSLPVCLELCMKSSKRPLTSKEISFLRFLFPRANPSYNQLYAHFELHQLFPTFNQNYEQSSARGQ